MNSLVGWEPDGSPKPSTDLLQVISVLKTTSRFIISNDQTADKEHSKEDFSWSGVKADARCMR